MRRRTFLRCTAAGLALPLLPPRRGHEPFLLSARGCGRATGYAEANKIVSAGGRRHVAWLDSEGARFVVRARTFDVASDTWSDPVTVGEAEDNHGGPALTQDAAGYLHVVYGPHHHPFRYRRSARPQDATGWEEEVRFGARCTYPTLVCAADGALVCTGRVSHRDRPWEALRWTRSAQGKWSDGAPLLRSEHDGYSHFQEALAWGPDQRRLHMAARFYSRERGHTVAHATSDDRGRSWRGSGGEELPTPFTAGDVPPIRQERDRAGVGLRCGALAVDSEGVPHVLVSSYDELPMRTWLYSLREGAWRSRTLEVPETLEGWGLTLPGGLVFDAEGDLWITLTLIRPPDTVDRTLWGHATSEPVLLRGSAEGPLSFELLTEPDGQRARWLPNLERPTAGRAVENPALIYTDGGKGDTNDDILTNRVCWLAPE